MARGKPKKKARVGFLRSREKLEALNAASLSAYIRNAFKVPADRTEGREALLLKAVKLHETNRKPLSVESDEDHEASPAAAAAAPAPVPAPAVASGTDQQFTALIDAITARLNQKNGPIAVEPPPLEPNERRAGNLRVTARGDFPEAAQYPALVDYVRERDSNDHTWFRARPTEQYPSGRRLMLGVIAELQPQQGEPGYAHVNVNGLIFTVARGIRLGLPKPHFDQLRNAHSASPGYKKNAETSNSEFIVRANSYAVTPEGECLLDPKTGEIVVTLSELHTISTMVRREEMPQSGAEFS